MNSFSKFIKKLINPYSDTIRWNRYSFSFIENYNNDPDFRKGVQSQAQACIRYAKYQQELDVKYAKSKHFHYFKSKYGNSVNHDDFWSRPEIIAIATSIASDDLRSGGGNCGGSDSSDSCGGSGSTSCYD